MSSQKNIMKKITLFISLFVVMAFSYAEHAQPKLVLQLVVDQLRGDLIHQHQSQFGSGGFNYLLSHGIDYHNAHHPHANTTTCAGHATIATGSYPSLHGVVDNEWYDRKSKEIVYCMLDAKANVLPTVHTKTTIPGRSPKNLKASTLSDEIILSNKGKAFAVSLKDRAAITLAGHAGKAFWFDKINGGFVTSSYYYSSYPGWVQRWNNSYESKPYDWELSKNKSSYQNANVPAFRHNYGDYGQTFPHHIVNPPSEAYFKSLSRSPRADQLTADFAQQLLIQEKLGQTPGKTDYLAISFSAVDAIGHQFGPNSLEAEDNLLVLDKTLEHLFQVIDKQIGLDHVIIVLTADHGVSDSPAYLKMHNIREIKPMNTAKAEKNIRELLQQRYNLPPEALASITPPYVYLDHNIINSHKLNLTNVSQFVAQHLNQTPGIFKAYALPITDIKKDWITAKVDRMAYPYRAGDVYLVQPPYQTHGADNEDRVAHGSPWQYDSYVPMLFANGKFKPQLVARQVHTTDIATTLSALLLIKSPSAAVGSPLPEVLKAQNS